MSEPEWCWGVRRVRLQSSRRVGCSRSRSWGFSLLTNSGTSSRASITAWTSHLHFFIPVPFFLLGTMGAVIQIRERIRSRNALLDIGAAGPLAGMVVAVPIVAYGIAASPVEPLPDANYMIEGRSLLYLAMLHGIKGEIPAGYDIMLTPTALAGWAGLLVTMINLLPFGQLDGGHVAYALWGPRQDRVSQIVIRLLPVLAVTVFDRLRPSNLPAGRTRRPPHLRCERWDAVVGVGGCSVDSDESHRVASSADRGLDTVSASPSRRMVYPIALRASIHA